MTRVWLAKVEGGKPKMTEYNKASFHDWCKENEGQAVRIEPEKHPVSSALRAYYFSAVLPVVRSTCDAWARLSAAELHEVIKKVFFYFETLNPKTGRIERFGRSVMSDNDWNSSQKAMQYLEIIAGYLADCGLEMPSAAEYKSVRDGMNETVSKIDYPNEKLGDTPF